MKVKFEPNEFEVGKEYHGKIVEVSGPVTDLLVQAHDEPEVFVIIDNVKHWLQNSETAIELGYDIYKRKMVTLVEINRYPTGDTFNTIGEPQRARDIYYPDSTDYFLLQAHGEPEVFVIIDYIKHWIQNLETATALNYDVSKRKQVSLGELNTYPTGDTLNTIGEPERARDIYYPNESLEFIKIGETSDRFIWSLMEHDDKILVGTYGTPKVYNYPPWTFLKNLPANESIRNFMKFKGEVYAATENLGHIYRMDNSNPTSWTRVHDDAYVVCLAFNAMKDYLYCGLWNYPTEETKIIRSDDGTTWKQVKHWSNRTIEGPSSLYEEELYVFGGWRRGGNVAWAAKSSDGTDWPDVPAMCGHNGVLGDCSTPFKGKLFVGLSQRNDYRAKIFSWDQETFREVFSSASAPDNHSCCVNGNWLYWMIGPLWKKTGNSYLYRTSTGEPGDWHLIKTFDGQPNGRALSAVDGKVYVGVQNKLYKIK